MSTGVRKTPLSLEGMPLRVQEKGGRPLHHQGSQLYSDTSPSLYITQPHTHSYTQASSCLFSPVHHSQTHSPPWCQCPHWSRSLDNVVKQLHGLHDVLVLDRDSWIRWDYFCSVSFKWFKTRTVRLKVTVLLFIILWRSTSLRDRG